MSVCIRPPALFRLPWLVKASLGLMLGGLAPAPIAAADLLLPQAQGATANSSPAMAPPPRPQAEGVPLLLQRASFWRQRQRPDMARSTLDQVLAIEPGNPEALYQAGLIAVESGRETEAAILLERLTSAKPGDVRIERLQRVMERGPLPPGVIEQARQASRDGDNDRAVKLYRQAFAGLPPPLEYAVEFFMAMAGTVEGWAEARTRIGEMLTRNPQDDELLLAQARILTYREASRREGITRLAALAGRLPEADRSWGEALLWLEAARPDEALYRAYLSAHPADRAVAAHWAKATAPLTDDTPDNAVQLGYVAAQAGDFALARKYFAKALSLDPRHAKAMVALASLDVRDGQSEAARRRLDQAFALDPSLRGTAAGLYDTAAFYSAYQQADAAFKSGRMDESERLLRPLLDGKYKDRGLAVTLMARVLAAQGKYTEAERHYRAALARTPNDRGLIDGLYGLLVKAGKWPEAEALAGRASPALREEAERRAAGEAAAAAKERAESLARTGPPAAAIEAYRTAVDKAPDDPWLRLGQARLLRQQGDDKAAGDAMRPLLARPLPRTADFHASALFALDAGRLFEAGTLLNAIPGPERNGDIQRLAEEIGRRLQADLLRSALEGGDRDRALAALRAEAGRSDLAPAQWGQIADGFAKFGDTAGALAIARRELEKPLLPSTTMGDYAGLIGILGRYGTPAERDALLPRFRAIARTPDEIRQIADMEAGQIATRADALRAAGLIAPAFDLLEPALARTPENRALLGALARLYSASGMNDDAEAIYDRLLAGAPEDEGTVMQLVWLDIGRKNYDRARQRLEPLLQREDAGYAVHYADGILLRQEGWTGAALDAFEKAQDMRRQELGDSPAAGSGLDPYSPFDGMQ